MDNLKTNDLTEIDDGVLEHEPLSLTCLPTEILLHIFSYLTINERLQAAGVCRQWRYFIFSSPRLWGEKQLTLKCSRQSHRSRRSIFFVRRLGHHLRKLTVHCEHPNNHQCKYMAVCFRKLIKCLRLKNPALTSFKVFDLRLAGATQAIVTKITSILTRLLHSLADLKSFQMSSAQWPPEEGFAVMEALFQSCRHSLHTLQIDGFFVPRYTPSDMQRFTAGITGMCRLTKLAIDYSYLSGDAVVALADSRRGQMKKLKLLASDISPNTQCIPKMAWQYLTHACPQMKVEFSVKGFVISPSRSIPAILDPAMRITMIRLSIGGQFTFMDTPRLNMAAVLHHVTTNFKKRLVRFEMDIDNHNDFIDVALIKLVKKCKHLLSLKVLAYFQNEETDMIVKDMVQERRVRQEGVAKGGKDPACHPGTTATPACNIYDCFRAARGEDAHGRTRRKGTASRASDSGADTDARLAPAQQQKQRRRRRRRRSQAQKLN